VGSHKAADKRAGRLHYTSHTPSGKPDGVALHYTCPTPEAVHWASPRGRPQHWYVKGHLIKVKWSYVKVTAGFTSLESTTVNNTSAQQNFYNIDKYM